MKVKVTNGGGIDFPKRDGDAGYDLHSAEDGHILRGDYKTFDTGVALEIPKGYCGVVIGRSGNNTSGLFGQVGLVDSGYRGTIRVVLFYNGASRYTVKKGDRIAQIVFLQHGLFGLEFVDTLEESDRGILGFGSTGT